ncbi:MAG: HYR domain-containing protein [Sphingobacteriales bacterium]|nr:HYR domain-containing protein [Sphingobacteriales bacterium]
MYGIGDDTRTLYLDNCGVASVLNSFNGTSNASDTYPVGTTTVVWTVTDVNGNTATCSHTVTVTDSEAPLLVCPADISLTAASGSCDAATWAHLFLRTIARHRVQLP